MSELSLWNEAQELPPDMTRDGEICEPLWAPVFKMDGGDGFRCKVWVLRSDAHVDSLHKKEDPEKRYALEAEFDGHYEQKLVVGSKNSHDLFKEMETYLKSGFDETFSIQMSGH